MKNIIITGTSSGIGLELVKTYSKEGFNVISLSRSNLPLNSLNGIRHIKFDITSDESIHDLVNIIENEYKTVDVLINNAGKLLNKSFKDLSKKDFYSVFDVNFFSVVNLIQKLLPFFNKDSHVVNISSVGGLIGSSKFPGLSAYSSSKGALNILTEVLAEEFKERGILCNCFALGAVKTDMLKKAFPSFKGGESVDFVAKEIVDFSTSKDKLLTGKIINLASSF